MRSVTVTQRGISQKESVIEVVQDRFGRKKMQHYRGSVPYSPSTQVELQVQILSHPPQACGETVTACVSLERRKTSL